MNRKIRKAMDTLVQWKVVQHDSMSKMYVEEFKDDYDGKTILLKGKDPKDPILKIFFEDTLSYRNTDESFLLKIWHETPKKILGNVFYKIENSSYLKFFNDMTLGLYKEWNITHYAIYTDTDCIDILSQVEPKIEWLK